MYNTGDPDLALPYPPENTKTTKHNKERENKQRHTKAANTKPLFTGEVENQQRNTHHQTKKTTRTLNGS